MFIFTAASHKALVSWFNALVANWTAGNAMQTPQTLKIPAQMPRFWKQNYIRAEQMIEQADTGDIIFFSGKMFVASM